VFYINGILTTETTAEQDKNTLRNYFNGNPHSPFPTTFHNAFNPSHLAGLGDLAESVSQMYGNAISNYDLDNMLTKIHQDLKTQKVVLVGHSQGTFYTNALYEYLTHHGMSPYSVGVYNIAVFPDHIAGYPNPDKHYLTSGNDPAVNKARVAAFLPVGAPQPLEANITLPIPESERGDSYAGHYFSSDYMFSASKKIVDEIDSTLNSLQNPNITDPVMDGCFTPPDLGIVHTVENVAFPIVDTGARGISYDVVRATHASAFVFNTSLSFAITIGRSISYIAMGIGALAYSGGVAIGTGMIFLGNTLTATTLHVATSLEALPHVIGQTYYHFFTPLGTELVATVSMASNNAQSIPFSALSLSPPPAPTPPSTPPPIPKPRIVVTPPTPRIVATTPPPVRTSPPSTPLVPSTPSSNVIFGSGGGGSTYTPPSTTDASTSSATVATATSTATSSIAVASSTPSITILSPTANDSLATTSVTFSGTSTYATLITILDGTTTLATSTPDSLGVWSFVGVLPARSYALVIQADNTAGESATSTLAFSITLPPTGIVINEIAWAGTLASANDQWVELHNTSDQDIPLDGITLSAADGSFSIPLSGTIAAGTHTAAQGFVLAAVISGPPLDNSYYLIESRPEATDMPGDMIAPQLRMATSGVQLLLTWGTGAHTAILDQTPLVSACNDWCGGRYERTIEVHDVLS
jgi:hypothetical protein